MTREELLEKRRAGFEVAYLDQFNRPPDNFCPVISKYINAHAQGAWWAWNAALDSVEIELPYTDYALDNDEYKRDVRDTIEYQGYKVKEQK